MTYLQLPNQSKRLTLNDFRYDVPESLVAQHPTPQRDGSRLLVLEKNGALAHRRVRDLPLLLPPGSLLVLNDTKVFASRLFGALPSGGRVEIFIVERTIGNPARCRVLARPGRKLKVGSEVEFAEGVRATVLEKGSGDDNTLAVEFNVGEADLQAWLQRFGYVPLPLYIKRQEARPWHESSDSERYQTVFARETGSVAAPTAGLHLSTELLDQLRQQNIMVQYVTLHVGLGTFLPVRSEDHLQHKMHHEEFFVPRSTVTAIRRKKAAGQKVVVVGTTALRCLEGLKRVAGSDWAEMEGKCDRWLRTDLFLAPEHSADRFSPWAADGLMTNFHQPESSLLMLVSYLIGHEKMREVYASAIAKGYRLFSYGDSSLLWL